MHGIQCTNVLLTDLRIRNFEVAGIHLNGGKNCCVSNCSVGPSRQTIPVLATYSQARFVRPHVAAIVARDRAAALPFARGPRTGTQVLADLDAVLKKAFENVKAGAAVDAGVPALSFLKNAAGNTDGGVYGIALNVNGVAVNGFLQEPPADRSAARNEDVSLVGCEVFGLVSTLREVVGVVNPGGGGGSYGGGGAFQVRARRRRLADRRVD